MKRNLKWPAVALLAFLAIRLPGLMALPIFCDESVYLRYAQFIRRSPLSRAFVSLVDPKPPIHYWLLALVFGSTADPLLAARLVSVIAGALSVLLLFPLCQELGALRGDRSPLTPVGRSLRDALVAADAEVSGGIPPIPPRSQREREQKKEASLLTAAVALFVTSPFLAFYQRLALAESLLVAESLLIAWLSLVWAGPGRARESGGRFVRASLALGLALAAAMLTKQNFSYVLFGLPLLAAALRHSEGTAPRVGRLGAGFLGTLALSMLLFLPYLFAKPGPSLRDRIFYRVTHGSFRGGLDSHARIAWDNWRYVFVPMTITQVPPLPYEGFGAPADAGWLWIYLTPPIFLLAIAGLAALGRRQEHRLFGFLAGWTLLELVPFVPFAIAAVPRYAVCVVPPLLLAAAFPLARWTRGVSQWAGGRLAGRVAAGGLIAALMAWPLVSIAVQDTRWDRQRLVRSDRWQYVSGWPCGSASRRAVDFLRTLAGGGALVVVTSNAVGTPNDVVWTYLDRTPNVSLFFVPWAFEAPILRSDPEKAGRLLLQSDFHDLWYRKGPVAVAPDVPILFVAMDPYPRLGSTVSAESLLRRHNPQIREIARFANISMGLPHQPDSVVIYRIR